jgi:hypothetical protein
MDQSSPTIAAVICISNVPEPVQFPREVPDSHPERTGETKTVCGMGETAPFQSDMWRISGIAQSQSSDYERQARLDLFFEREFTVAGDTAWLTFDYINSAQNPLSRHQTKPQNRWGIERKPATIGWFIIGTG